MTAWESIINGFGRVIDYLRYNRTIWWLIMPLVLFGLQVALFPATFLIKWLSWILAVISIAVVVTYLEAVWSGLRHRGPMPRYTHLALGIFLGWLAIVENRTWVGLIRMFPLDMEMRQSYFIAFYVWTSIVAAFFHLTAPRALDGRVPTANWIKIGVAVAIGVFLGIAATVIIARNDWAQQILFYNPLMLG